MDSNNEKKKMSLALKLTIAFICVVAALTFYSKTMYNAGVPTVQTSPVKSEQLRIVHYGDGMVLPKETAALYAPGDYVVAEVLVKKFDEVNAGDVLAVFELPASDTVAQTPDEEEPVYMDTQYANLLAPFDGIVIDVSVQPGMLVGRTAPVFELCNEELGFIVKHVIPEEMAKYFKMASVDILDTTHTIKGTIISREPAPEGGVEITIELEPGRARLKPYMLAKLELVHVTADRQTLVPLTAIYDGEYVFKLIESEGPLGMEYFVKRTPVEVGAKGEGWVSVTGDIRQRDQVVISSDKLLADERVKIYKEG